MLKKLLIALCVVVMMVGCVPFIAGAAIGSVVVYEGRNWDQQRLDSGILSEAESKIYADQELRSTSRIFVSSFNGVVLIGGQTPTLRLKKRAQDHLKYIPGIRKVYNEIQVMGPTSPLTQSSDAWITTKIKTLMLGQSQLSSGSIKVVTENGIVYLMGTVTRQQAKIAANVSRKVSGVEKVVTLFEYKDGKKQGRYYKT